MINKNRECEATLRRFIETCHAAMPADAWKRCYPEAERIAGETRHVVEALIDELILIQMPVTPDLRKAIDAVLVVCGIARNDWQKLARLNYDAYWKSQYGYA